MREGTSITTNRVGKTTSASKETKRKRFINIAKTPYFEADDFILFQDDSLKLLEQIPSESIDMVFADPPYNLSNGGFTVQSGKRVSVNKGKWDKSAGFEDDLNFHYSWIEAVKRVLKPEGTLWVSGTYHSIYQCGYAIQHLGYKILNDIAWYKPNASPNLSGRYFTASHETLLWAKKNPEAKHVFNYKILRESPWQKDVLKKPGKQMRSVWSISTTPPEEKKHGKHPTQKPLDLLRRIIVASTKPDAIILDPFTGSSSTGIAASEFKRKFIGVDLEKEFLDLSIKRYQHLNQSLL